jgi:hypothetical protein
MNEPKTKSPIWDKANSTYMRIIYLSNGVSLTGYSKKYQQNERRDKIDLLTNWILRDFKNGYLDRKTTNPKITVLNHVEYFIKQNDTYYPVVNLYYDFPEWVNQKWMDQKKFFYFVQRFYQMIRQGLPAPEILNALEVRTRASSKDPFDIGTPRFANMADLNAYVARLRNESDLEEDGIEHFYRKYKEKYFTRQLNNQ